MNKLQLFFAFLKILLTDLGSFLKNLYHFTNEQSKKNYVLKTYAHLNHGLPDVNIMELLPGFESDVINYTYLDGTSRPIDIALLNLLVKERKDCDYMEIGTWRGESISNVAAFAKSCTSVSLPDDEMEKGGWTEDARFQRFFSEGIPNVNHVQANSHTFDFSSLGKKFDVIFIDGDHSYKGVRIDTENAFKLLKDENSVIVWHDYGNTFEKPQWEVLAGMMDGAPREARKHIYHVSNTLCAIYHPKAIESKITSGPQYPDKVFNIHIKAEKYEKKEKV